MSKYSLVVVTLLSIFLPLIVQSKKIHKRILSSEISESNAQTVFLAKFGVTKLGAEITLKYKQTWQKNNPLLPALHVGFLRAENFYQFLNAQSCQQKAQLYHETQQLKFVDNLQGIKIVKLSKTPEQHMEFLYFYDCTFDQEENRVGTIVFDINTDSKGLAMQQYGVQMWPYVLLLGSALFIIIKYGMVFYYQLESKRVLASIMIAGSFVIIFFSIFFKCTSVMRMVFSGEGIPFFDALYITFKIIGQILLATIMTSLSWSWLLNNQIYKKYFIIIVLSVSFFNIITEILSDINKEQISQQNLFQGWVGKLILILRIINLIIFLAGCTYINFQSQKKRQSFINNFMQGGSVFFLANIISVVVCVFFWKSYRFGEVIPMLEDVIKLASSAYLCYLFIIPRDLGQYHGIDFGIDLEDTEMVQREEGESQTTKIHERTNRYEGKSADLI